MTFNEMCKTRFEKYKTVLCIGLDPVLEKIPFKRKSNIEKTLVKFYYSLIDNFHKYALAVKPNIAFYEQYGIDGYKALKKIIARAKKYMLPVILDAKRGDIGSTAKAYAKAVFNELDADAVTLSPYLGSDSLTPFFKYKNKGFFILARTSNPGSRDFQLLKTEYNDCLYIDIAKKICEWNNMYSENIGAVAGATHLHELNNIIELFSMNNNPPLLIPGVGKQGGDFNSVVNKFKEYKYPLHKIFINSSSKINYAYEDHPGVNYLEASLIEIKKMLL